MSKIARIKKLGVVDREKSINEKVSRTTPDWAKYGIIYQIYTRNFRLQGTFKSIES